MAGGCIRRGHRRLDQDPAGWHAPTSKRPRGARVAMLAESQIPQLMAEATNEPDADKKLDLAAHWLRLQMELSSDVIRAFREASRFDEEVAADHRRILDNRARNMRRVIDTMAPSLAAGVTPRIATDLLWAFSNEELYRELVAERGWTPDRFEKWLATTLRSQLLGGD